MATVCETVTEWVETTVSKPIEEWEERQEKECKKRKWYDPRRWVCWLVTHLVKVIRWVLVTVTTAVVKLVCRLVSGAIGIFVDALQSLWQFLKALFTWDKCALQEALAEIVNVIAGALLLPGSALFRPITDRVQRYRLRRYVGEQIDRRFGDQPATANSLKELFGVDHGTFGYRLDCRIYRMYVDSRSMTETYPDVPNLIGLQGEGVDLYRLAGFDRDCSLFTEKGWYRPRPQTATYPFAAGGGGFGEPTPPTLSRDQLKTYVESSGSSGPHFRIYAISPDNLATRIDVMEDKGRQLGLILNPVVDEIEVKEARYINYSAGVQRRFLVEELKRKDEDTDRVGAFRDLCSPVAVAVFGFTDLTERGVGTNLVGTGTRCGGPRDLPDANTSGVSFIDDIPDALRKYVLIHELGHYFGLCHVDGFDRIMTTAKEGQGTPWTKSAAFWAFLHGGARFTHDEAKLVWNFVLDNFPLECFGLETNDEQEPVIL